MEIKDLAGLSQPLTKLIEVIASGIGNVSRPFLTRKNADAKAYEIVKIAGALSETRKLMGAIEYSNDGLSINSAGSQAEVIEPEKTIEGRTLSRFAYQETKRQRNIEEISRYAAEELSDKKDVSDERLDEDWISRFFAIAQDVSTEEMQVLWGKVLAGEVSKPKSYSLRTLDTLKNLTKYDAEIFAKVARAAIWSPQKTFILKVDRGYEYLESEFGITFLELLTLKELGLIVETDLHYRIKATGTEEGQALFIHGDTCIIIKSDPNNAEVRFPIFAYSRVGQEILPLVNVKANVRYIQKLSSIVIRKGLTIKCGEILSRSEDGMEVGEMHEVTPIGDA